MTERTNSREAQFPLIVLGVAVLVAASVVVFLLARGNGGKASSAPAGGGPALVSQSDLERLADDADHPVYWAGPRSGYSYELTVTPSGRTFVRYLPKGVAAGDPRAAFLTVGTYPGSSSYKDLKRASKDKGTLALGLDDGGIMLFSAGRPTSVYFGYPGKKFQVEVFAPSAEAARKLVLAGRVTPIR
jgi:hypothetical protein